MHRERTNNWLQDDTREIPTKYEEKKFAGAVNNCQNRDSEIWWKNLPLWRY